MVFLSFKLFIKCSSNLLFIQTSIHRVADGLEHGGWAVMVRATQEFAVPLYVAIVRASD